MIEVRGQSQYVLTKRFSKLIFNQTLQGDRKHIFCYCFQSFSTAQTLKRHVNICFEINGKQTIKMAKKDETVKLKNYTRKIKSPPMIYDDFKSILIPENNAKQNPDEY